MASVEEKYYSPWAHEGKVHFAHEGIAACGTVATSGHLAKTADWKSGETCATCARMVNTMQINVAR